MDAAGVGAGDVCMDLPGVGAGDVCMDSPGVGAGDVCMDSTICMDSANVSCSVLTNRVGGFGVENCSGVGDVGDVDMEGIGDFCDVNTEGVGDVGDVDMEGIGDFCDVNTEGDGDVGDVDMEGVGDVGNVNTDGVFDVGDDGKEDVGEESCTLSSSAVSCCTSSKSFVIFACRWALRSCRCKSASVFAVASSAARFSFIFWRHSKLRCAAVSTFVFAGPEVSAKTRRSSLHRIHKQSNPHISLR